MTELLFVSLAFNAVLLMAVLAGGLFFRAIVNDLLADLDMAYCQVREMEARELDREASHD